MPSTIKTGLSTPTQWKIRRFNLFFSLSSSLPLLFIFRNSKMSSIITQLTLWCELPHCFFSLENQSRVEYWVSKRQFLIPNHLKKMILRCPIIIFTSSFDFVWWKLFFLIKTDNVDNFKRKFSDRSSNAIEKKMQKGAPRPELFVPVSLRYCHYAFSLFDFLGFH